MASIKKNFLYSSILTVSNYIFPLVVFPHISRVLGVTNIGMCNFVDGIINYFILVSMLGTSIIGIREIAQVKSDSQKTAEVFSTLFIFNAITTFIALLVLVISIYTVPQLSENKELMFIGVIKVLSNFLLIEWFYTGLEKFKFITNRTIVIKILYVLCIFLFVREREDSTIYYFLTTIMITINALMNCWFAKSFFKINLKKINFKHFFKPTFVLGIYAVLTSMYVSFNVVFLGFSSDNTEVGYYTTAAKIYTILLALYTAFTNVMMPRMSFLLGTGNMTEFKKMIGKSQDILFGFTIPISVLAVIFAPEIIYLIAGNGYEGAIIPLRIIMPLVIIIGYEQILVLLILTSLKKDKAIFINSIFGAVVGISLNFLLVPVFKSIGSSLVWFVSECVVLVSSQYFVNKFIAVNFPYRKFLVNILWAIPGVVLLLLIKNYFHFHALILVFIAGATTIIYFLIVQLYFIKNEMFLLYFTRLLNFLKLKNN